MSYCNVRVRCFASRQVHPRREGKKKEESGEEMSSVAGKGGEREERWKNRKERRNKRERAPSNYQHKQIKKN